MLSIRGRVASSFLFSTRGLSSAPRRPSDEPPEPSRPIDNPTFRARLQDVAQAQARPSGARTPYQPTYQDMHPKLKVHVWISRFLAVWVAEDRAGPLRLKALFFHL